MSAELEPIRTDELLACIGELYLQARLLRQTIQRMQQQPVQPANGQVDNAKKEGIEI